MFDMSEEEEDGECRQKNGNVTMEKQQDIEEWN